MKKYEASFPFYWWEKPSAMTWSILYYRFLSNQEGDFSWKVRYMEHTLFLPSAPVNFLTKMPRTVGHAPPSAGLSLSKVLFNLFCVSLPVAFECEWWVLSCFLDSHAGDRHRKVFVYSIFIFLRCRLEAQRVWLFPMPGFFHLIESVEIHYCYFQLDIFPPYLREKIPLGVLVLVWFSVFSVVCMPCLSHSP